MIQSAKSSSARLAFHLRALREQHAMTLDALAEKTGLSRATLSRIEKNEVSPTADTLGRLASAYVLPISQLLAPMEQSFQPVVRRRDQAVWNDPKHEFERRSVSPPSGQLAVELIEVTLGAGQSITYDAPAVPGQEHHLFVLSGQIGITVEGKPYDLRQGDCLRYLLFGESVFKTTDSPCNYVIALS